MELLNGVLGRNTDGRDEELGALVDNDVEKLVELAAGVVVVGLTGGTADRGEEKVDTEGGVLAVQALLELADVLAKDFGGLELVTVHSSSF